MHRIGVVLCALALSTPSLAEGPEPGSVLVYPTLRSEQLAFTIVSVTNRNLQPAIPGSLGGTTAVHFEYVNAIPAPPFTAMPQRFMLEPTVAKQVGRGVVQAAAQRTLDCQVLNRVELLTPADTLSVLVQCAAPGFGRGYLVVSAQDPMLFMTPWSFNHLMGSEVIISPNGGVAVATLAAHSIASQLQEGDHTDVDGDGQLDFDGIEYRGIPDELYIDSFLTAGASSSNLSLINLTGGTQFVAVVNFDIWNDNEFALSGQYALRCYADENLADISLAFTSGFLNSNTPHDPTSLDTNCDGIGDLETGWARIRGLVATSELESQTDPAILGALIDQTLFDCGRPLWQSRSRQFNGDFLKFGAADPEN